MDKVYVIGTGHNSDQINRMISELCLREKPEIIYVESMEDIPIAERLNSANPNIIVPALKLKAPKLPESHFIVDKKYKGHERPYKFHR